MASTLKTFFLDGEAGVGEERRSGWFVDRVDSAERNAAVAALSPRRVFDGVSGGSISISESNVTTGAFAFLRESPVGSSRSACFEGDFRGEV